MMMEPITAGVRSDVEIDNAIASLGQQHAGLVIMTDSFMGVHRGTVISAALRNKVPTIFGEFAFAREGGLILYGSSNPDLFRRSARFKCRRYLSF